MSVEQLYTQCLAQGAYFIFSDGEAAVIDPIREPDAYLALSRQKGCTIKYIFETHFHADFVSGHLELAARTGATIVYGPTAVTAFDAYIGHDEEVFNIGSLRLKLLHTPGHTLESCCYLLEEPAVLFSGDTFFFSLKHDGSAVGIIRAKIQAIVATQILESHPNIGLYLFKHMSQVQIAVCVGQSACNQNLANWCLRRLGRWCLRLNHRCS